MADTKWKPGESGNPNGRPPKGQSMTEILERMVSKEEMAERLIALARDGDMPALKYIYDRIDGKPKESKEISGGESPLFVKIEALIDESTD